MIQVGRCAIGRQSHRVVTSPGIPKI